jgi:hypothetical protein
MPYKIRKVTNKKCYRVSNKNSKRIFSKCTTMSRGKRQMKLLRAIQYNKGFRPYKTRKRNA